MPKRTKATKKTDIKAQKAWLRKKTASKYQIEVEDLKKVILIVGEGQTEKLYFESFPVLTLTVEAVNLKGQSKLKLIELTQEIIENSEKDYDEVWCVFDMDYKEGKVEYAQFDNAIERANNLGYKVAYSNDVFELWFYLHFQYTNQKSHRNFYYEALSKIWGMNYKKEGKSYAFCKNIYSYLENDKNASQENAIQRAAKLYDEQSSLPYHEQNPVTLVYQLVTFLNENLRK